MEITTARALKIKKILAGKLVKVQDEIQTYNSVVEGTEQPDVVALLKQRESIVGELINLKSEISRANRPIERKLMELVEAKVSLPFWNGIDTTNGDTGQYHYGTEAKIVKKAAILKEEKAAKVTELEALIEDHQESIDQHNYSTKITVSENLLKLAGVRR